MNRHVIKGRGENRGKYLCWARMAPERKATEDGFVWLRKQRKAVRWEDPLWSGCTWATERARMHDGYFVKLVASGIAVDELRAFIAERAADAEKPLRCYWFGADFHEAGQDFCRACAEKLVDEKYTADPKQLMELYGDCESAEERYHAAIDGGWDIEHDDPPYCATCGAKLSGSLTDYGADQEIEALTSDCAPTFDDVEGWAALDRAVVNLSNDDPRWRAISKVVLEAVLEGLISLLAARTRLYGDAPASLGARTGMSSVAPRGGLTW